MVQPASAGMGSGSRARTPLVAVVVGAGVGGRKVAGDGGLERALGAVVGVLGVVVSSAGRHSGERGNGR